MKAFVTKLLRDMKTFSGTDVEGIVEAIPDEPFEMRLNSSDMELMMGAVKEHNIRTQSISDLIVWRRLGDGKILFSGESLKKLVRALLQDFDEARYSFASSICFVLGIELV